MSDRPLESDRLFLEVVNEDKRDSNIRFEENGHKYFVHGESDYISTTTIIHNFFPKFDGDKVCRKMVSKKSFRNDRRKRQKYEKYFHLEEEKMVETIVKDWNKDGKKASDLGSWLHRTIEVHLNRMVEEFVSENFQGDHKKFREFLFLPSSSSSLLSKMRVFFLTYIENRIKPIKNGAKATEDSEYRIEKELKYFQTYAKKLIVEEGYVPFRTEWLIYDTKTKICGSIDAVFYHPEKKIFRMVDWKRSKEIREYGFRKYGWGPFDGLQDCNMNHYTLQQLVYRNILLRNYSWNEKPFDVEAMYLVVLHPIHETFQEIPLNLLMQPRVDKLFGEREMELGTNDPTDLFQF